MPKDWIRPKELNITRKSTEGLSGLGGRGVHNYLLTATWRAAWRFETGLLEVRRWLGGDLRSLSLLELRVTFLFSALSLPLSGDDNWRGCHSGRSKIVMFEAQV